MKTVSSVGVLRVVPPPDAGSDRRFAIVVGVAARLIVHAAPSSPTLIDQRSMPHAPNVGGEYGEVHTGAEAPESSGGGGVPVSLDGGVVPPPSEGGGVVPESVPGGVVVDPESVPGVVESLFGVEPSPTDESPS